MSWAIQLSDADISSQTLAYTVPSTYEARLTVEFTNRSTSAASTVSLWVVPSGEGVGNQHIKESGTTLGLAGTRQGVLIRKIIAPAGAKVYVQASTANVSCQVSGDVVSPDNTASALTTAIAAITPTIADIVDVQAAYGATGDGSTDDSTAIASANTASKYLYFPAGTYLIDGALTPQSGAVWISDQRAVIKRKTASVQNSILYITGDFEAQGLTFDGNKAANSNPCNNVAVISGVTEFFNCNFINAKLSGGYGGGLAIIQSALAQNDSHTIDHCVFHDNDGQGMYSACVRGLILTNNYAYANGSHGFYFDNYDLTFTQKINKVVCTGNKARYNTGSGIVFGNFNQNNNGIYGTGNPESTVIAISGNVCANNGQYGMIAQGEYLSVTGNVFDSNGTGGEAAGLVGPARYSTFANNTCSNNTGFGLDAGWSSSSNVTGNTCIGNTLAGINCGGSANLSVTNNHVEGNNAASSFFQITAFRIDLDGSLIGLDRASSDLNISNNDIYMGATDYGILVNDGFPNVSVCDNNFLLTGADVNKCLILIAADAVVKGNRVKGATQATAINPNGSGVLVVPEIYETIITNSVTTVDFLNYYTDTSWVGSSGVGWVDVSNGGTGYTANFAVIFSGGGGAGAAGTAYRDQNGVVTGVRMSSFGTGYTSAPAVSFANGAGAGAVGTATVGVPLISGRDLDVYTTQACTITRLGTPNVESKAGANLTMAARDAAKLKSFSSRWNVLSRAT